MSVSLALANPRLWRHCLHHCIVPIGFFFFKVDVVTHFRRWKTLTRQGSQSGSYLARSPRNKLAAFTDIHAALMGADMLWRVTISQSTLLASPNIHWSPKTPSWARAPDFSQHGWHVKGDRCLSRKDHGNSEMSPVRPALAWPAGGDHGVQPRSQVTDGSDNDPAVSS